MTRNQTKGVLTTELHGIVFHGVHRIYSEKRCAFTLCFPVVIISWIKEIKHIRLRDGQGIIDSIGAHNYVCRHCKIDEEFP